jgi:DNA (cytosine-5)-methyltransferase 1
MEKLKLGSLFDGIGGFPFAAMQWEIEPVWASEIEPFPIKVTEYHFPDMKHLGDITQINGAEIEPVDIITFGSPCQDLSVAGKREGLAGARSGLFMEAVRIIRGMRAATGGKYPRFAVWENVPGAFSSNKGQDFRAVLEEIGNAEIPMPKSGRWATAGMVRTETADIAWRVLDAQYHGVPQRRRRIFLVADFGGQCAGEILFVEQGLSGDSQESGSEGQEAAGNVEGSIRTTNNICGCLSQGAHPGGFNGQDAYSHQLIIEMTSTKNTIVEDGICPTLTARMGTRGNQANTLGANDYKEPQVVAFGICSYESNSMKSSNPHSGIYKADTARTLDLNGGNPACNQGGIAVVESIDVADLDCRNGKENGDLCGTLQAKPNGGFSYNCTHPVRIGYAVRRLTPLECERLQGLPDNWTDIEWIEYPKYVGKNPKRKDIPMTVRKKRAVDTQRYKAIGNSVAIPCVSFILRRISEVLRRV